MVLALLSIAAMASAQEAAPAEDSEAPRHAANINWNPKTTVAEIKQDQAQIFQIDNASKSVSLSSANEEILRKHIQISVNSFTVESQIDDYGDTVDQKILAPIERGTTSDAARRFMLDVALKTAAELLRDQPPIVQYRAVLLIGRLNERPADISSRPQRPPVPYLPAARVLMDVVTDTSLNENCRFSAAHSLTRILLYADPPSVMRGDIGHALAQALEQKVDQPLASRVLHLRLVEALGASGRLTDTASRPVVIDALLKTLASPQEEWIVRGAAARAVSQLPFESTTNVELINHEIGKLCYELGQAYNASPRKADSDWRWSFALIYLSYRSATEMDQKQRHWGLQFQTVTRGKAEVDALYNLLLPILKPIIERTQPEPIDPAHLKALGDWLSKHNPSDRKVTPASEELKEIAPSPAEAPMPMTSTP